MVPKDTQKSNHCCPRVSTHKSSAPQLCHRLHTAKPTRRSWLGWPALRMHGTLGVVRRPTMRQEEPYMDLSCNPPPCVVCRGATRAPMVCTDDICRSLSSTSSSGSRASQGRSKLLDCKLQGPTCRARCQRSTRTTGKKIVPTCPSFSPPVAYVHCKTVHLGAYL